MSDWDTPTPDGYGWMAGCLVRLVILCLFWAGIGAILQHL